MALPNNLLEFYTVLVTRQDLFPEEYQTELETLLASLDDDPAVLNKAISIWCLEHPEVEEAMWTTSESEMVFDNLSFRFPKNAQPDAKIRNQDEQLQKADLLNAIRRETYPYPPTTTDK